MTLDIMLWKKRPMKSSPSCVAASVSEFLTPLDRSWSLADAVQLACVLEASAPKVGNVHPRASFADMRFAHFATSAVAIRPAFESTSGSVGDIVLAAVEATVRLVGRNTNLGTLLLFAPLAVAAKRSPVTAAAWQTNVRTVLERLTSDDARMIYEAIRLAKPGGLGQRSRDDIASTPPTDLIEAMRQVAEIDAVARQYTNDFADIFQRLLPWFDEELMISPEPLEAIGRLQIRWLAHERDGLIERKVGEATAREVQRRAQLIWERLRHSAGTEADLELVDEFDQYLRADAHRRNPGTTADLIAATLLVRLVLPSNR